MEEADLTCLSLTSIGDEVNKNPLLTLVLAALASASMTFPMVGQAEDTAQWLSAAEPEFGVDMRKPPSVEPEFRLDAVHIKWVRINPEDIPSFRVINATGAVTNLGAFEGLAIPFPDAEDGVARCVILAPEPRFDQDDAMNVLGHEVAHCFLGRWHGRWSKDESAEESRAVASLESIRQGAIDVIRQILPEKLSEIEAFLASGEKK